MKRSLLIFILLVGLVVVAQALPNATFSVNRTGDLSQIPQSVLFNSTTTEPGDVTAFNLSVQGSANNTVWRNETTWTDYEYTYNLAGNFTPYLLVHYADGTNQSQVSQVNTSWTSPVAGFTIDRTQGYIGQNPQSVLFTDSSTQTGSITLYNLSLYGPANDTVWENRTSWPAGGFSYTYNIVGNFSPYLNITDFYGGTNQSQSTLVNVTDKIFPSFVCTRPGGSTNLNGTKPFTVVCNDTSAAPIDSWIWYGTEISTNKTTNNISIVYQYGGYKTVSLISGNGNGTNVSSAPAHYIWVNKPWWQFW